MILNIYYYYEWFNLPGAFFKNSSNFAFSSLYEHVIISGFDDDEDCD